MELIVLTIGVIVSSIFGTLAGFGVSTILLPFAIFVLPLPTALLFVGIIHLFSDFWRVKLFKGKLRTELLFFFGISGAIASVFGAKIVLNTNSNTIINFLGGFLIISSLILLIKPKLKLPENTLSYLVGGTSSGYIAGLTGISGPLRSFFLNSYKMPKERYLFTSGVVGIMTDIPRLFTYSVSGAKIDSDLLKIMLFLIPVSVIGATLAKTFERKIPEEKYKLTLTFLLLCLGVKFALT